MAHIKIVSDSTCDLSKDLIDKYHISVIPLCVVMDDVSYYDGEETNPDEMYKWADANKTTPKTAAATFEKAEEVLKPFMDAGDDIIFIGISTKMSTTCNVIRLVGNDYEYNRLFIVDSANLSTGVGLQVIKAAELAKEGKTSEEIVAELEAVRDKVRASFVVDTLTYLARGGRCNAVTALLANTLQLHPKIIVENGAMVVGKKYHGGLNSAIIKYAKDMNEELLNAESKHIFITHSGCEDSTIEKIKTYLKELNYFEEIHVTRASGVISSHCGPGTLGVLFYSK